ncbi:hypothetical protein PLICRDRAFT_170337 [Plicaturopsis crispa FD-325 SS-3]|nr:hypothetical protein PLICRDRAFT_170337 [Plicaturopsis crispa FD-325 SS-3]
MSRFSITMLLVLVAFIASVIASPVEVERRSNSGQGTWFEVGLGNCGKTSVDSDHIVALATSKYASGAHCNKKVTIKANGVTKTATVMDSCPSCASGDLDMSPSLFKEFASLDVGVLDITWSFD